MALSRYGPFSLGRLCLTCFLLVVFFIAVLCFAPTTDYVDQTNPDRPGLSILTKVSSAGKSAKQSLGWGDGASKSHSVKNPILNSTLGFQRIFALSLPDRRDRVEPLMAGARASNINVTIFDAVRDKNIPSSEYPQDWIVDDHAVGVLGCLTSHIRVWKKMVAENIGSALILEDDADWDLRLHSTLQGIKPAVDALIDFPFPAAPKPFSKRPYAASPSSPKASDPMVAPYGEDWDLLVIGHCSSRIGNGESRVYSWNDPTTPPPNKTFTIDDGRGPGDDQWTPGTRTMFLIHGQGGYACTFGYGISLAGAVKLLAHLEKTNEPIDIGMSHACGKENDLKCLIMWPQVINSAGIKTSIEYGAKNEQDKKDAQAKADAEKELERESAGLTGADGDEFPSSDEDKLRVRSSLRKSSDTRSQLRSKIKGEEAESAHCDAECQAALPPGGGSVQFSARRNAPLILHDKRGPADLVSNWQTMYAEVTADRDEEAMLRIHNAGSRPWKPHEKLPTTEWQSVPLDPHEAFDPANLGQGLSWVMKPAARS